MNRLHIQPVEEKGEYLRGTSDGKPTAYLSCPGCGLRSMMSDHTIDADGTVNPSVACPVDCGFHQYVVLDGWGQNE